MKMIDPFRYDVIPGETVTIKVTPVSFGASASSVEAVFDGSAFAPVPNTPNSPTYTFTVTKPPTRTHRVIMEFTFLPGSPKAARYDVSISGQSDQNCPCGFTVNKTTGIKEPVIRFMVK
jgi:hypothetical protein